MDFGLAFVLPPVPYFPLKEQITKSISCRRCKSHLQVVLILVKNQSLLESGLNLAKFLADALHWAAPAADARLMIFSIPTPCPISRRAKQLTGPLPKHPCAVSRRTEARVVEARVFKHISVLHRAKPKTLELIYDKAESHHFGREPTIS
jgi:hypothetical protein